MKVQQDHELVLLQLGHPLQYHAQECLITPYWDTETNELLYWDEDLICTVNNTFKAVLNLSRVIASNKIYNPHRYLITNLNRST